jgi:hypothetical protein
MNASAVSSGKEKSFTYIQTESRFSPDYQNVANGKAQHLIWFKNQMLGDKIYLYGLL